jgi:hypothetical protein
MGEKLAGYPVRSARFSTKFCENMEKCSETWTLAEPSNGAHCARERLRRIR